jgi:hypothetical protein
VGGGREGEYGWNVEKGGMGGRVPKRASSWREVWSAIVWCVTVVASVSGMGRDEKKVDAEGPMPPQVSIATGKKK